MRIYIPLWCIIFSTMLCFTSPSFAHRVNIFAYIEHSDIVVECSFSKTSKVRQGTVEVRDAATNELLTSATTDDNGMCRIPVPEKAYTAKHNIILRILAGEGHQNEWIINADELTTAIPTQGQTASHNKDISTPIDPANESAITKSTAHTPLTEADVTRIVNQALDAHMTPITRMLAASLNSGPTLRDIIGGIGWILGLCGIAAYMHSRKN